MEAEPLRTEPDRHDEDPRPVRGVAGFLTKASFATGSVALVGMMGLDFLSVIGRNIGVPLVGVVELIQFCVVFAISSALVAVTLTRGHTAVHLLTERLSPTARTRLGRVADLLAVIFFGCMTVAEGWLLAESWGDHERTDLLRLPIAPLRIVWTVSLLLATLLALRALFRAEPITAPVEEDPS